MIEALLKEECDLQFFRNNGYVRKKCPSCGSHFWTLNPEAELCGDQPCVPFSFINKPTTKKHLTLTDVRNSFLNFFEQNNHQRLTYPETGERCPVIARWRTDIYLTIASIADFQPHVTSGTVPPPANPLVISQPCIRLNDLDEVGKSGRHLTIFEMMGHHAFNKNINEIYWKEETVAYADEYFTKKIGIPKTTINYKEHLWIGGGNAGPCLEVLAEGLEIATLVFMNMNEDPQGTINLEGTHYTQNPLNIVDTGYGLERIAWFTQGTPTVYETVFPEIITWLTKQTSSKQHMPNIYSLADHSKCLAFMLGDGIVPSNVKAGYLARLIIRRALRFLEDLKLNITLSELVSRQLKTLSLSFPELKKQEHQIYEILDIETQRYTDTLTKGESLVKRIVNEKKTLDTTDLITLYDTHGMPPFIVQRIAQNEGLTVSIPKHFDSMIAELHSHEKPEVDQQKTTKLPETKPLYENNHYLKEFTAQILWTEKTPQGTKVILNQTAFYPEGGGQPGDLGSFHLNNKKINVLKVEKENNTIIHYTDGELQKGDTIQGTIDWERRYTLMKHHTGTHVINGSLRELFGEHIWQAGSQLGVNEARFDFSHYKSITEDEIKQIQTRANTHITKGSPVEKRIMERNNAEHTFGFRLYQGGVPPGNHIKVLNIPGLDVEACGGTHLANINEIEKIRIIKTERIQDGINRIIFAAGKMVDLFQKEEEKLYQTIIAQLQPYFNIQNHNQISQQLHAAEKIFSVPKNHLNKTITRFLKETHLEKAQQASDLNQACNLLFTQWKATQKTKKKVASNEIQNLLDNAETIPGTNIKLITGRTSADATVVAGELTQQPNIIAHIFDGKKITSAASENVAINLQEIAPEIGKILGGSGGGKPKLTQSGGPQLDKIQDALKTAKQLTKKKFEK